QASNPMAINLIRRIAPNSFDRGPASHVVADFAVRQCGDIVLACTSRWSKLPCIEKPGWAGIDSDLESCRRFPNIVVSAARKSSRKKFHLTSTGTAWCSCTRKHETCSTQPPYSYWRSQY